MGLHLGGRVAGWYVTDSKRALQRRNFDEGQAAARQSRSRSRVWVRSEAICQPLKLEGPVIAAIFLGLESNFDRDFVSQGREVALSNPVLLSREACHADPNRARPLLPCAPAASDVFAYSEHAARRVSCIGACLVSKVKDHSGSPRMVCE